MYGNIYAFVNGNANNSSYFDNTFIWDGTSYKLTDAATTSRNNNTHYTCSSTNKEATCTRIKYYVDSYYFVYLNDGESIEDALLKMQQNNNESNLKVKIDSWYAENMIDYTNKLEDTIWCNDRSVSDIGGWNPNGGDFDSYYLDYAARGRVVSGQPSLTCSQKNDRFTVNNTNGNGKLTYPVATLTNDELTLAGAYEGITGSTYLSGLYWTMSPYRVSRPRSYVYRSLVENPSNHAYSYTNGGGYIRPAISLKPSQLIINGTGTVDDPYVIE